MDNETSALNPTTIVKKEETNLFEILKTHQGDHDFFMSLSPAELKQFEIEFQDRIPRSHTTDIFSFESKKEEKMSISSSCYRVVHSMARVLEMSNGKVTLRFADCDFANNYVYGVFSLGFSLSKTLSLRRGEYEAVLTRKSHGLKNAYVINTLNEKGEVIDSKSLLKEEIIGVCEEFLAQFKKVGGEISRKRKEIESILEKKRLENKSSAIKSILGETSLLE